MDALALVINNYVERKRIKSYTLTPGRWLVKDWGKPLKLGTSIAFVYEFRAMLNVRFFDNTGHNVKTLLLDEYENYNMRLSSSEGETPLTMTEIYNDPIKPAYSVGNQFVAIHSNELSLKHEFQLPYNLPAYSGYINYLLLTPIETC